MATNNPYEQDSGVLSTILGTAATAAAGYGFYRMASDPVGSQEILSKVFNTVFPIVEQTPNVYQARTIAANRQMTANDALAASRRTASFHKRRIDTENLLNAMDVHSPNPGVRIENPIKGVMSFHGWGYKNISDFNEKNKSFVKNAGNRIQTALSKAMGGLNAETTFSGTTMNVSISGNKFEIHTPKFDGSQWLARENGNTVRVHKLANLRYGKAEGKDIFVKGVDDPISNIVRILEDPMELMAYANRGTDQGRVSREIWDSINKHQWGKLDYQGKIAEIKRVAKTLGVAGYDTDLTAHKVQDVLTSITREEGQWIAENDKIGMDYFGKQMQVDWWSMVKNQDDAVGINLRKINSLETTGVEIRSFFEQFPEAVKDFAVKTKALNPLYKKILANNEAGWTNNQTQIAERAMSIISPVGAMPTAEMFKARARGYKGLFDRASSKTIFSRVAPVIRSTAAESIAPNLLNPELQTLGVLGILDPTISDVTLFRPEISKDLYAAKAHTYTVNRLATSKDSSVIKTAIEAHYEGGEYKEFESLQHFLESSSQDQSILANIKKLRMAGNTTIGVGAGNDLLDTPEAVSLARQLADKGGPVNTHTAFEMYHDDIGALVNSWNHWNQSGGEAKMKVSGYLVSMASKLGDAVLDSRWSAGSVNGDFVSSTDSAFGKIRIKSWNAEQRAKAVVEELKEKKAKLEERAYRAIGRDGTTRINLTDAENKIAELSNDLDSFYSQLIPSADFAHNKSLIDTAKQRRNAARNKIYGLEEWRRRKDAGVYRDNGSTRLSDSYEVLLAKFQNEEAKAKMEITSLYDVRKQMAESNPKYSEHKIPEKLSALTELKSQRRKYLASLNEDGERIDRLSKYISSHEANMSRVAGRVSTKPVDARIAFDLYKNTIPVKEGLDKIRAGKGATGYLTFLEYSLLGHIGAKDQSFTGEAREMFKHIAEVGTQASNPVMSARSMLADSSFYFNQHLGENVSKAEKYASHVNILERYLATSMKHGAGSTIDKLVDTDEAIGILTKKYATLEAAKDGVIDDSIKGENAWYMWQQIFPHENEAMTQGKGFNIFRIGLKETPLFNGVEGTLAYSRIFNTVNTTSIMKQGQFLEETLSETGKKINFAERGVSVLETSEDILKLGADGYMLNALADRNNLRNPEVMTNTFFGSDKYFKDGFGIRYKNSDGNIGTMFVGGGAFQGMNQYLGDEDIVTLTATNHASYDLVRNAYENGGIATEEAALRYSNAVLREHGQGTKGGYKKFGAPHIELTSYSRNLNDTSFLGNKDLMKFLSKNGEEATALRSTIGHSVYMSRGVYEQTVEKHISEIQMAADTMKISRSEVYKEIFGAESQITKMLEEGMSADKVASKMAEDSIELAKRISQETQRIYKSGQVTADDIKTIKNLTNEARAKATSSFVVRHPMLYPGSGAAAHLFAMDEDVIGRGKSIMTGDLLNVLYHGDFDGDKLAVMLDLSEHNRSALLARMERVQKYSLDTFDMIDNKKLIKPAGAWANVVKETFVPAGHNGQELAEATEMIGKVDTAVAAYLTKGLTGSADIHTHGIVSDLLNRAKKKGLSPDQLEEFGSAVGTFIPWNLVQKSISSKHLERIINADGGTRLMRMMQNIGGIDKEAIHANIRENEGALSLLDIFSLADINSRKNPNSAWVSEGMPHYDTLFKAHYNLEEVSENQFVSAMKHVGFAEDIAKSNWDARVTARQALADAGTDITPLTQRVKSMEAFGEGFGLMDIINPIRKNVREQPNPFSLLRRVFERNKRKGLSELDSMREVFEELRTENLGFKHRSSMEGLTGEVGLISRRSIIGLSNAMGFVKEHMTPTRAVGLAGLAMVGTAAINMLFGDATPMSPNDLPSVNNPSFRDSRYNNMLDNRTLNNVPNANVSSGLLTDSYSSYDSVMNHLQSNFGNHYSSVSVRHDGQDPYKEHMMMYNM